MRQRDELELLKSRISFVVAMVLVAFGILAFGFWSHQIAQAPYYRQLAERNRIRDIRLVAPRGRIFDREHRVIADSRPSYDLLLTREDSPRPPEETIAMLAPGLEGSREDLLARLEAQRAEPPHRPIVLREDLSVAEIAFIQARRYELPDIRLEFQPRRRYEQGELAAHVLGYVGQVTQRQLAGDEFAGRKPGDVVGQSGLERQYNALLQGQDGIRRIIRNNVGREMGVVGEVRPTPGRDLVTTLDLDLQLAGEMAMGGRTGVAVAIAPRTGEVLALVSRPAFDPSLFVQGIRAGDWQALISDPRKPLQNRAIQSRYSPGSVFKMFMAAAALEEEEIRLDEVMFCPGHAVLYGNHFNCWRAGGHGRIGLHNALMSSCNVFFYTVGDRLGIDRIARYATMMGLGRRTGIDLPAEDPGLIPSQEWKMRTHNSRWYPGETISVSIGQGAVAVTPLQLTWAVGGLASGGTLIQPHLVDPGFMRELGFESAGVKREQYRLHQPNVRAIQEALWDVVSGPGTGTRARVAGFEVAGKTGTAQVASRAVAETREDLNDHAWFVGFAPYDDPEIVVGVFVENGGGGGAVAAPIAQKIFQVYFDKKVGSFTEHEPGRMARLVD